MTLIDTLRVAFAYCFYKVKLSEPTSNSDSKDIYTFKLYPRKIPMTLLAIIISPFVIFLYGIISLFKSDIYRVESWSNYTLKLPKGTKPTKLQCYSKF